MKLHHLLEEPSLEQKAAQWINSRATNIIKFDDLKIVNGKIDYDHTIILHGESADTFTKLPFAFGKVKYFEIHTFPLTTFENFPEELDELALNLPQLTSLSDIHKYIKKTRRLKLSANMKIKDSMLGLLKLEGLETIDVGNHKFKSLERRNEAINIIRKYLGQGLKGIAQAQRELLENDLDDYAEF